MSLLGGRPTVGPQTLDLLIGVRIPASQLDLLDLTAYRLLHVAYLLPTRCQRLRGFQSLNINNALCRMIWGKVGVSHRSLNVLMPEEPLDGPDINSAHHPLCRAEVPEIREIFGETGIQVLRAYLLQRPIQLSEVRTRKREPAATPAG